MEVDPAILMIEDIYNAMRWVKQLPSETRKIEDDFKILHISDMGIEKIELKPLGKKIIDNFIAENNPTKNTKPTKIETFLGIKVVVSNDVEEFKLE